MRLFVLIGGLLVAVLTAALVVPYFIDWTDYRSRFEAEASRILGEPVTVAGSAEARLIPFPSVTFSDVRVGPPDQPVMTVERFSMDAELAPFLSGEILIFDLRLSGAALRLDLDDEGRPVWNANIGNVIDPADVKLENARFTDSTVIVRDGRTGRSWAFTSLSGTAAADSLQGPWRVEADGLVEGEPVSARVSSGTLSRDGFALRIAALLARQDLQITTEGRIAPPEGELSRWYTGTFTMEPASGVGAYKAEGLFEADARAFIIPDFRAEFGAGEDPYVVTGNARLDGDGEPSYELAARGNQVRLGAENEEEGQAVAPTDLRARLASLQSVIAQLPIPPIPGTVSLDLPAVVAGETTIRDLKLEAVPSRDGETYSRREWTVQRFEAKLPGRTVLEAMGTLSLGGRDENVGGSRFVGDLLVASRQPSGLASWLTSDVPEAIRRLPSAGFSATVSLDDERQVAENLELILGDAQLNGRLVRLAPSDQLPLLEIALTGDKPDFETIEAVGALFVGGDRRMRITGHDVDLALDFTNPRIRGITLDRLGTSVRVRDGVAEIDRLSADGLFGASVSTTATVRQKEDGNDFAWDVSVVAAKGAPFLEGLSAHLPLPQGILENARANPAAFDDMALTVVGSAKVPDAGGAETSASIAGDIGGTAVNLTATAAGVSNGFADPALTLSGTLENPELSALLLQAGVPVEPIRPLGAGRLNVNLSGSVSNGLGARLALEGDLAQASYDGVFHEGGKTSGRLEATISDVEPFIEAAGYIVPGTGLGTAINFDARMARENGVISLEDLKGAVAGSAFAGSLTLEGASVRGTLTLDLLDAAMPYGLVAGRVDAFSEQDAYQAALHPELDIDVAVEAAEVLAGPLALTASTGRVSYKEGVLAVTGFDAMAGDAEISANIDLRNNAGTLLANIQGAARGVDLSALPGAGPVSGKADISLNLTGTGSDEASLFASLTGAGAVAATDIAVAGLSGEALPAIISRADAIGYEITEQQISAIADELVNDGSIAINAAELPISVSGGVVRLANITLATGTATLRGEVRVNLAGMAAAGEAALEFDPGEEEVAGPAPRIDYAFSPSDADGQAYSVSRDDAGLVAWIRQRALEREQARVEAQQARLIEKQRLRRSLRTLRSRMREEFTKAEEARLRVLAAERLELQRLREAEEAARLAAEQAEEAERKRLEAEEAARKAAEDAARKAEEDAAREAQEAARRAADENAGNGNPVVRQRLDPVDRSLLDDPLKPLPDSSADPVGDVLRNLDLELPQLR